MAYKIKKQGRKWVLPDKDRTKKFAIVDNGKIVSKHINFYLAQTGAESGLKNGKLSNDYKIVSLKE